MSALHRENANGLEGLQNVLDSFATGKTAQDVLHNWAVAVAADKSLDDGHDLRGTDFPALYQLTSMNSEINWGSEAYSEAGAPPNGSDYVSLRKADGTALSARELSSLSFKGATAFAPLPTEWTIDGNPPLQAGNPAYFGGRRDNMDNAMIRSISVPAASPSLAFDILWSTEVAFDTVYVQVSTDNGQTWHSLANADMVDVAVARGRREARREPARVQRRVHARGGTRRSPLRRTRGRPCSCRSGTSPT